MTDRLSHLPYLCESNVIQNIIFITINHHICFTQGNEDVATDTPLPAGDNDTDIATAPPPTITPCVQSRGTNKKRKVDSAERVMEYALNELQSMASSESVVNDDAHHMGQLVENELRAMDSRQRAIAKKLISDVIFYGNIENLCHTSHIVCGQKE